MTTLRIPGLIDPHVHLREPGATHKEDWYTGTCAALAVLAMPNTQPPLTDLASVQMSLSAAESKAVCDYGVYLGGTVENTLPGRARIGRVSGWLKAVFRRYVWHPAH